MPFDIADPAAQYLRDLEIAPLLRTPVDAKLLVTRCCRRRRITDVSKVFGSVGPADDRTLALPPADSGADRGATRSAAAKQAARGGAEPSALDRLFDALTADQPATWNATPVNSPSEEWTVAGVKIRTAEP